MNIPEHKLEQLSMDIACQLCQIDNDGLRCTTCKDKEKVIRLMKKYETIKL
jgi:hypothetical protein